MNKAVGYNLITAQMLMQLPCKADTSIQCGNMVRVCTGTMEDH